MALIGLSGKQGSGKDTVGKIIQDLTAKRGGFNLVTEYTWQIKKFSDKLKDMVCILIGCTREQLESQEFKSTPLGEEWNRWKLDTTYVDEVLDSEAWNQDNNTLYFSSKESAVEFAENEKKQLHVPDDKKRFGNSGDYSYEIEEEILTPRDILQSLGTDYGRNMLHPDVWSNSLFTQYKVPILNGVISNKAEDGDFPKWIITDLRFKNEKKRIEELGGITIRVNRKTGVLPCIGHEFQHPSETDLDNEVFNYTINNNGSIEDLIEVVKEILIREKIIK